MNSPRRPDKTRPQRRPRRRNLALGIVAAGTILLALVTLSESATQVARAALGHSSILNSINNHLNPFRTRHALYQSGLPVYDLKIESTEYRRILNCVEQAKKRGFLSDDLKRWAKATFIHQGVARKVRIRVRGDGPNHWSGARKSWRIRFRKDDSFEGQREFNLILPTDGKGIYERFTNAVFARLGMMTLRDGYAVLRINGIPQGVYYQTEHWDEALLAHHRRPTGTIFANPRNGLELGSFREQVTDADEAAQRALQLLLDYELDPTQSNFDAALAVTDVDDYLRWVAGTTLFSSDHTAFTTDNHKLYYDPSRGRFYRFPWDIEPKRLDTIERFEMEGWHSTFDVFGRWPMSKFRVAVLQDNQLRLRRNRLLWSLVRDDSLNELFKQTYEDLERALWCDVMAGDRPEKLLDAFRRVVARNVKQIRESLAFSQAEMRVRRERSGLISLQMAVNCMSGIVVNRLTLRDAATGVRYTLHHDVNGNGGIDTEDRVLGSATADASGTACFTDLEERLFPEMGVDENYPAYVYQSDGRAGSRYKTKPMRTVVFPKTSRFDYLIAGSHEAVLARGGDAPLVEISAVNAVTDTPLDESQLHIRAHARVHRFDPHRRRESRDRFLERHPAFRAAIGGDQTDTIVLPRGTHEFRETVVVPEGMTLVIEAGADIAMGPNTSLVCFGPIRAEGTKEAPIRIHRTSNNPGGQPWGTLASVRADEPSVFRFVHLEGGQGDTVEGIRFTGALAVHDGDVVMEDCRVTHCPAEDGVNFKNGNITIERTYFADNASDALDLDFVQGDVVSSHFEHNGGDAIDFSGSTAHVLGNRIERSGDKGISVGEESNIRIADNLLLNNVIGVAVKDRSQARIDHCTFLDNDRSVAVYRKKPIFGGATADVGSSILLGGDEIQSSDRFSTIRFVDSMIPQGLRIVGCTPAPPDLQTHLRSQGFVLAIDNQPTAQAASPAAGDATRPGLVHPPVDLR